MPITHANNQENTTRCRKKVKTSETCVWQHYCVTCGADVVNRHVLPYFHLSAVAVDEESDSESYYADNEASFAFRLSTKFMLGAAAVVGLVQWNI